MQRRDFVERISAALAATLAAARAGDVPSAFAGLVPASALSESAPYEFLTGDQARLLDVITSHLVPSDETPGAREAHVVKFIDHAFATIFADDRKEFAEMLDGFTEFTSHYRPDGASFVELSPREQVAALHELERLEPEIFGPLRDITMLGMFCHPELGGNYQKVGWKLIGYVDQYSWVPPFGYYDRDRA